MLLVGRDGLLLDERHRASPEAQAGEAGAIDAFRLPGPLHQPIQLGAGNLVQVAEALVGAVHQLSEAGEVPAPKRFFRLDDPLVLLHDVETFLARRLRDQPHAVADIRRPVVSQRGTRLLHGQHVHAGLAVLAAPRVLGIGQAMGNLGVRDKELHAFQRQGHVVVGQEARVDEHGVAFLGQAGDELVHHPAAGNPHELILGFLRKLRELFPSDVDAVQVLDGQRRGRLQRRRRREAGSLRDIAVDGDVHAAQRVAGCKELADDGFGIVRPAVFLSEPERRQGGTLAVLVVHRVEPQVGILAPRDGHAHGEIDGHGEDEAVVVVGVLTHEIHPAWCPGDDLGRLAELLDMALLHWIHQYLPPVRDLWVRPV